VPAAGESQRDPRGRDKSASAESAVSTPASAKPERAPRAAADPQDYGGWVSRGDQLFSKGDHEGASKAYKAAIALRPSGSEANSGLGFSLLNEGHARESLPYFDRASSSGYAEANIGLGDAYRKLGQPSSAKEAYEAYLERLPSGARADYARRALDKLKGGSGSSDKPADNKPAAAPSASGDYRPAGELIEPSAPSPPTTPTAPAASPPTAPSETPP
jgi:tetratricopeptide (TPR) repeat protein